MNPFAEHYNGNSDEQDLIVKSVNGDRESLEQLVLRHQAWIYNIAMRMIMDPIEAEDVTQEILIKFITKLSSYDASMASFRTWLYRIVANHVLNLQKTRNEKSITEMTKGRGYYELLNDIKDTGILASPERYSILVESKTLCLSGMLICLDPRQRLVFILAVLFGATDTVGSEIISVSRSNYRKILSRARDKLYNFFNQNCSLMDNSNPCKCSYHDNHLKEIGLISDEGSINQTSYKSIGDLIGNRINDMEEYIYHDFISLYREQPMLEPPDLTLWIRETLESDRFRDVFNLH